VRTRTLVNLRDDVRRRVDVRNMAVAFPDADINEDLNQGWTRIYGKLCLTGEPYYLTRFLWTTTSAVDTYYTTASVTQPDGPGQLVLPTDIYRIKGLDAQVQGNKYLPCARSQFEERDDFQSTDLAFPQRLKFDERGSGVEFNIILMPAPPAALPMRLWYYPNAVRMVSDSDTIDGGNGWEVYAIDWAARRLAEKDENYELAARLDMALAEMMAAIDREAANRIAGIAPKIRRARYKRDMWWWPR